MSNIKNLATALDNEHPCSGDNTCDIAKAVELGLYLWAGHVLGGATECPETNAAMAALNEEMGAEAFEAALEEERKEMVAQPHLKCGTCGAVVYTDADEDGCNNCGAGVRRETNDEEE